MRRRHHWLQATALSLTLASCAVPTAGTNRSSAAAPVGVPATAPVATPGVNAPAPAVPSLPPAPPVAEYARLRVQGTVAFNDQPVSGATLTAVDLATGRALTHRAWSDVGVGATGTQRTDARGAFDLELPKMAADQVVKLIAVSASQTFTALFDARGRAVGAAGGQGASYRLAEGRAVSIAIRLRLSAGSTAAAKAFEGVLKLTFQLPGEVREAERSAALAAAEEAAREVEAALATRPDLAQDLVVSVGSDGEVKDVDGFRSAVARLGVFDKVFEAVKGRLLAVTARNLTANGQLAPITAEDFPLDRVTIRPNGAFSFTGGSIATLGGSVTSHFVPTPERGTRRAAPAPVELLPDYGYLDGRLDFQFTNTEFAWGVGAACLFDENTPGMPGYTVVAGYKLTDPFQFFDGHGELVATADLSSLFGSGGFCDGLVAHPASRTLYATGQDASASARIWRLRLNPDFTAVVEDSYASTAAGSYNGADFAGGRVWTLEQQGFKGIASFDPANLSVGPQLVASGGVAVYLGAHDLNDIWNADELAVHADGVATHIYWLNARGRLWRLSEGAHPIATRVCDSFPRFDGSVALLRNAPATAPLYVNSDGFVYAIDNPHQAGFLSARPQSIATAPTWAKAGDQVRPGSALFVSNITNALSRVRLLP